MKLNILTTICLLVHFKTGTGEIHYGNRRAYIIEEEAKLTLGGTVDLNSKEMLVNNCLLNFKFNELDYGFNNPEYFNLSQHYFMYRDKIRNSGVYKIIKDMPKGAALHVHDMGILGPDYLMNITYLDSLYVCFGKKKPKYLFSADVPKEGCLTKWFLLSEIRKNSNNIDKFNAALRKHFTMVCNNPDHWYPNIKYSWKAFMQYFSLVEPLLTYRPVWENYIYDALQAFKEDNIQYVEIRTILPSLYELDGTVHDPIVTAMAYSRGFQKFVRDNPQFTGGKIIYAPSRLVNSTTVHHYIEMARKLKDVLSKAFAGFDLVGEEDVGGPLVEFLPELEKVKDMDFFFHAGETDWYGAQTDENLVDAILLGAKRIGHGYALSKHPILLKEVLKNDIAIEVNVISNVVLSLVRDIRNHPLATFLALGLPVVLSSDDPGVWEADPISHDYYVAFVGVASKYADLRMLKTLALNSLKYSALIGNDKTDAIESFNKKWNTFIHDFDCKKYY